MLCNAALLLIAVLAQVCVSRPIRADFVLRRRFLKRLKSFSFLNTNAYKPVLALTKN